MPHLTFTFTALTLALILGAQSAQAQPQPQPQPGLPLGQISVPTTGLTLFTSLNGRLVPVTLSAGIALTVVNGRPTLTVTLPLPPPPAPVAERVYHQPTPIRTFDGNRTTVTVSTDAIRPDASTVVFTLNGLTLQPGADYDMVSPGVFQFVAGYGNFTVPPENSMNLFEIGTQLTVSYLKQRP